MARERTHTRPHLHARSDSGRYAYVRIPHPDVAALVVGQIDRSWSTRPILLQGGKVIKFSLGSKDVETACRRWDEVHHQVEALVSLARIQLRKAVSTLQPQVRPVAALTDEQRATIAAQAHHDVLADDDLSWTHRDHLNPLARAIVKAGMDYVTPTEAANETRNIEAEMVRGALSSRSLGMLDIDATIRTSSLTSADLDSILANTKVGHVVSEEHAELLKRDQQQPGRVIPSELSARLTENGLSLPSRSHERRHAGLSVLRAKARAHDEVAMRVEGKSINTPTRPASLASDTDDQNRRASGKNAADYTLDELHAIWVERSSPEAKTISHNRHYVERFKSIIGDLPIGLITRDDVRTFRETLRKFPKALPRHLIKAHAGQILAWAAANPEVALLSRRTINSRAIGGLSTLFGTARSELGFDGNPTTGMALRRDKREKQKQIQPFSIVELNTLFQSDAIRPDFVRHRGGGGEAQRWIPLLAVFSGARLEELGQLHVADVRCEEGIDVIAITTDMLSDAVADDDGVREKRLKTDAAQRDVPLHPRLVELGFLKFVETQRNRGEVRLFPGVDAPGERVTKNWGRWWARYQDKVLGDDPTRVFHSFRHTFIDGMREGDVEESVIKTIFGHSPDTVTRRYGRRQLLNVISRAIRRLSYPGLHLMGEWPKINEPQA